MSKNVDESHPEDFSDSDYGHDDYDKRSVSDVDNVEYEKLLNNLDDVDQHYQGLDQQVEALQAKVEDLTMELEAEKNLHEATRLRLEQKNSSSSEIVLEKANTNSALAKAAEAERALEMVQKELSKTQNSLESTKKQLESERQKNLAILTQSVLGDNSGKNRNASTSGLSDDLKEEFTKFCDKISLDYDIPDPSDLNEESCKEILQHATDKFKTLKRSDTAAAMPRPIPQGSESELQNRVMNLEEELRLALNAAEDIRALKAKVIQLVGHIRHEKECRVKADSEVKLCHKKMNILSNHIEKLMAHLKHEATSKIKYMDQLKLSESEVQHTKQNVVLISKKSAAKDKLIIELREGSKVLEDQLRLMDEKYLELRTKLDFSRDQFNRRLKKAEKLAQDLRMKFMMAGNTTLLDAMPLPVINTHTNNNSFAESGNHGSTVSWAPDMETPGASPNGRSKVITTMKSTSSGGGGSSSSGKRRKSGGGFQSSSSSAAGAQEEDPDAQLGHVLEKIRRHKHESAGWSDDKLKDLVKTK